MTEHTSLPEWYVEIPPPCTNGHVWLWTSDGANSPEPLVGLFCRCALERWRKGLVQEP